ncbi:atrial natriuretic peptide receptor 3-like [Lineus longissimus]|uniref:atrial natriuretic peptide receptor 3-like n=1 Tax=Lineus longissimus TaxID=88925 RepID=UPI00315CAD04
MDMIHLLLLLVSLMDAAQVKELSLMVFIPQTTGNFKYPFGAEMSGGAVLVAIDDIEKEGLLPNHILKPDFVNSRCNAVYGFGNAHLAFANSTYDVIIGPACSSVCRMVARLAAFVNIPCFAGVCQDSEMLNKKEFTTLVRFMGTFEKTGYAFYKVLQRFNWHRVSIIWESHNDKVWWYTLKTLEDLLVEGNNFTIATKVRLGQGAEMSVEDAVRHCAGVSRIILLAVRGESLRNIAIAANKQGLINGRFIFLSAGYYEQPRAYGNFHWRRNDTSDEIAKSAYTAFFFIYYFNRDTSAEYDAFQRKVKEISLKKFGFTYEEDEMIPYPAANLYEAVYLYARSINETVAAGGNISNGTLLSHRLWGRSFHSITGELTLNDNGDREQAYTIKHLQNKQTGDMEVIGHYFSTNDTLVLKSITWPGDGPPIDHPPCGYSNEFCEQVPFFREMDGK